MSYKIKSAQYANEDSTAVVMMTEDFGAVLVSELDRPELWEKLQAWIAAGGSIDAMPVQVPAPAKTVAEKLAVVGLTLEELKEAVSK